MSRNKPTEKWKSLQKNIPENHEQWLKDKHERKQQQMYDQHVAETRKHYRGHK